MCSSESWDLAVSVLLQKEPGDVVLGEDGIPAITEAVSAEGKIGEAVHDFAREIPFEQPVFVTAVRQGNWRRIVILGDEEVPVGAPVKPIVDISQALRIDVDKHTPDERKVECSVRLEVENRLGVHLKVGDRPEMFDGAFVDFNRGQVDAWDQTAEGAEIQPAVGSELDGGLKLAGVSEDFGEKVKEGGFVLGTLVAFGVGIAEFSIPEVLLLGLMSHCRKLWPDPDGARTGAIH